MENSVMDRRCGMPDSRSVRERIISALIESDTTWTKISLMVFTFLQSIAFFDNINCGFVACEFLRGVMPYWAWGTLFGVWGIVEAWRIIDGTSRPTVAKVINGIGAFIFGGFATALIVARWPHWILAVPYVVFALDSVWVASRTSVNPGRGFRGD